MRILWLVLAGLTSGVIGGMGMGGGTLLIPILTIFLGFAQKNSQAINLLVFVPMSVVALAIHMKNKLVDFSVGIPMILVGIIFSISGSLLASQVSNGVLRSIFGGFLLSIGIYQGVQTYIAYRKSKAPQKENKVVFRIFYK